MNATSRLHLPALFTLALALLIPGCHKDAVTALQGYVEGEFVHVASSQSGRLEELSVQRGDQVQAGAALFTIESGLQTAAHAEAKRRLQQAQASLADLKKGRRPTELAAMDAQLLQARTALALSEKEYQRQLGLSKSGATAMENVDRARATQEQDLARVAQIEAELATARLGAREDQIQAAEAAVSTAEAVIQQARWSLDQVRQSATEAGQIFDTLYRPGEWVPAGRPVAILLPPGNIKVRFFVPLGRLSSVRLGQAVSVHVDGQNAAVTGKVSFISPKVEYTPPVIYSAENRAKLVFMVEATFPPETAAGLHPGQPVDVTLP